MRAQDERSTNHNSGVCIDAIGHDGNKDNYFGVIEEMWELDYGPVGILAMRINPQADKRVLYSQGTCVQ